MITIDWRTLASTFGAVFVAELGDKTQLATMSMSAGTASKGTVFVASALALCTSSALAVLAGGVVSRFISPLWLRRIAGAVFVALGIMFLLTRSEPPQ